MVFFRENTEDIYVGQYKMNSSSVILSGEMMFCYMESDEAALNLQRIEGVTKVSCSGFGENTVKNI